MEEYIHTPRKRVYKPKTPTKPTSKPESEFYALDLRNQGLVSLSPTLFTFNFIYELHLDNNQITVLPDFLDNLKNLEVLSISNNSLQTIPSSLCKLTGLKELNLSNNSISSIPTEIGSLISCTSFSIDNNPLMEPFASIYKRGGKALLTFCKDHHVNYASPMPRSWVSFERESSEFVFTLGSYNVLSNTYATEQFFNYVPVSALKWENRKGKIINEILNQDLDILCCQEVETEAFISFFRDQLQNYDYDSLFYPKGRARNMASAFNQVDGCATFWKKSRFNMIEHKCIEFTPTILSDLRFKDSTDVINRNANKDNIALITVMRSKENSSKILIIANVHIAWDPEYRDVKLIQTIVLTEEVTKMKMKYKNAGVFLTGDFNSLYDSDVYKMITQGKLEPFCNDFDFYNYSVFSSSGYLLSLEMRDSYFLEEKESSEDEEELLGFTNWTAQFKAVIDYIFYGCDRVECLGVLAGIDRSYEDFVVGLPSVHLPSDHILIAGKYSLKDE